MNRAGLYITSVFIVHTGKVCILYCMILPVINGLHIHILQYNSTVGEFAQYFMKILYSYIYCLSIIPIHSLHAQWVIIHEQQMIIIAASYGVAGQKKERLPTSDHS